MASGGLISSLFRDNSFASRSTSMFHKNILKSQTHQERSRSQTIYPDKNPHQNTSNKYLPVARMVHTLAVKLKKTNYFFYCRLQANLKKCRSAESAAQISIVENNKEKSEQISVSITKTQNQKNEKIAKGYQNLLQIFELNQLKHQNSLKIEYSFKRIKYQAQQKEAIQKKLKILSNNYKDKISSSFKALLYKQKLVLKAEICNDAIIHVVLPKYKLIFKKIRDYAIQQKILCQEKQRRKKQKKLIDPQSFYIGTSESRRLKSISEQSSSIISQEETVRFNTPQKKSRESQNKRNYQQELQKSKTSRKQSKMLQLMKKETKKDNFDESISQILKSSSKKTYEIEMQYPIQDRQRSTNKKLSTKKQALKPRLILGKAYKIETTLQDKNAIRFPNSDKMEQKQLMLKNNRLYAENVGQMLPDLHDNIGVFQSMGAEDAHQVQQFIYSHRTIEKSKSQWVEVENNKTISHCKASEMKRQSRQLSENLKDDQQYQNKGVQDGTFIKQISSDKHVVTASSRAISNSYSSPKFCVQTGINTSTAQKDFVPIENKLNNANNQFYSSPLEKIEQMMIDLEKLRERQKYNSKYTSGYQKCKISVNLPKKTFEGRSYQASASKANNSSKTGGAVECKSQKKQLKKQAFKRFSVKESKQQKQNIEVKLWDEKQKFLFYVDGKVSKQRKKSSSGLISSMNQSQINTARKMKKQIENIINNRKSRTSLGTLKLARNKY